MIPNKFLDVFSEFRILHSLRYLPCYPVLVFGRHKKSLPLVRRYCISHSEHLKLAFHGLADENSALKAKSAELPAKNSQLESRLALLEKKVK